MRSRSESGMKQVERTYQYLPVLFREKQIGHSPPHFLHFPLMPRWWRELFCATVPSTKCSRGATVMPWHYLVKSRTKLWPCSTKIRFNINRQLSDQIPMFTAAHALTLYWTSVKWYSILISLITVCRAWAVRLNAIWINSPSMSWRDNRLDVLGQCVSDVPKSQVRIFFPECDKSINLFPATTVAVATCSWFHRMVDALASNVTSTG